MSHSPTTEILTGGLNYCSIPPELNPNEHECSRAISSTLAFVLAACLSSIAVAAYSKVGIRTWAAREWRRGSPGKRWNPLNGALWGAVYIIATVMNALSMGHSASERVTLQLFQLLLAVPRFGWWDIFFYMIEPVECRESAADALVTETTIGMVALGFVMDMVLRMSPCGGGGGGGGGGAHTPLKIAAFFLPALELAAFLFGCVVLGLIMWKCDVKRVLVLPSFALMVTVTITSLVFWIRFQGITAHMNCPNGWGLAPQITFQLFLPMIIGNIRFIRSCAVGRSFPKPAPIPEQHQLSEL
ncbi:hypothetical protein C7212DRAFT_367177 [Tuber magnatum]|uniref:Uncharacterized protein n=1 Tax=Tuber magnatum TaxID=42249 RepID=A0A317SCA4_9PEZI|nr:hypothetical protein C7212DRAFT_367177 [Tuber magnatum]